MTWRSWETNNIDSVLDLEILEKTVRLIQFWTWKYWEKNIQVYSVLTWKYWKAPCCLRHLRKSPFWEHVPGKTQIYNISLKADSLIWFQKRHGLKNDYIWRFRVEISHMRPIQGWKLKLIKVHIYGKLKQCPVALP